MLEKCVSGDGAAGIGVNVVNVFVSVHPPSGEDEQEPVKPNAREKVAKIRETLHCGFESAFGNLGAAVGKRPWITILICCLFAGVACTGLFHLKFENRIEELWVPANTQAKFDKKIVEDSFPRSPNVQQVLLTSLPQGGNVLTPDALAIGQKIHERVKNLKAQDPLDPTVFWAYEDLCVRSGLGCWHSSILLAVGSDTLIGADEKSNLQNINNFADHLGNELPLRVNDLMGGISYDSSGRIAAATATTFTYFTKQEEDNQKYPEEDELLIKRGKLWETAFLEEMAALSKDIAQSGYIIDYISSGSWDRELQKSLDSEVWLLYSAIILILLYTVAMLSKWSDGLVGTRGLLALIGIVSIGVAFASSVGLCSYMGIVYSPLMGLLPFLLLGVGVDNMFVIVNAFDKTHQKDEESKRMREALEVSGTSITVTSLTNLLAFVIGALTSLPVLRAFAIYATLGVLCNYILQVTLFPALLVLDAKRQAAAQYDFLPFIVRPSSACPVQWFDSYDGGIDRLMKQVGEFLQLPRVKAAVIIVFITLAGCGIWGLSGLTVEADLNKFIPENSYIHSFSSTRKVCFPTTGDLTAVYVQDVSFTDPTMWQQMKLLSEAFRNNKYIDSSSVISWFDTMQKTVNATGDVSSINFHEKVIQWLESSLLLGGGSAFKGDVAFNDDRTKIVSCRLWGTHTVSDSSLGHVQAMDSLRKTIASVDFPAGTTSFVFADQYLLYEQVRTIGREATMNISLALIMILSVVLVLQMNAKAAILTWINIVLAVVEMVGLLRFWGIQLDTTLVIFVVVSMGLIVDYSAHVVHRYVRRGPTEGVVETLEQIGPAVVNAAGSTFFAILVLAFAKSYAFVLFFRTFFLCVLLGLAHGLLLLPVLLSLRSSPNSKSVCTEKITTIVVPFDSSPMQKENMEAVTAKYPGVD